MAITGSSGAVYIGTNKVGEMSQWTLDCKADNKEVTNFDSNGWKEFLATLKEWSGKFEGNFISSDAGQQAIITAFQGGTTVSLKLNIDSTKNISGNALVNFSIETPFDDKVKFSADFQGTGPLTFTLT